MTHRKLDRITIHAVLGIAVALYLWATVTLITRALV
jgi:hypothetical protein